MALTPEVVLSLLQGLVQVAHFPPFGLLDLPPFPVLLGCSVVTLSSSLLENLRPANFHLKWVLPLTHFPSSNFRLCHQLFVYRLRLLHQILLSHLGSLVPNDVLFGSAFLRIVRGLDDLSVEESLVDDERIAAQERIVFAGNLSAALVRITFELDLIRLKRVWLKRFKTDSRWLLSMDVSGVPKLWSSRN